MTDQEGDFQLAYCLRSLVNAASFDGVLKIEDAVQFNKMESCTFGVNQRSITFFCKDSKVITFTQIEKGARCKIEYNLNNRDVSVDFSGQAYPGLSHKEIFAFYFDE